MDVIERDIAPAAETARVDRAIACLRQAPSRLETFDGVVELDFEGVGAPWFVRGPSGEIGQRRPDGPVQASLTLSADNLVRLIDGQFDPRCGFMFGQIKVAGQDRTCFVLITASGAKLHLPVAKTHKNANAAAQSIKLADYIGQNVKVVAMGSEKKTGDKTVVRVKTLKSIEKVPATPADATPAKMA